MPISRFSHNSAYLGAMEEAWYRNRPGNLPYVHKWWARRLQTTSSLLIATALGDASSSMDTTPVIYDPFMGMGSLVSAGLAAGYNVAAGDISAIPHFAVRTALTPVDRQELEEAFNQLLTRVRRKNNAYWTIQDGSHTQSTRFALWIKVVPCPSCQASVELYRERTIGGFLRKGGKIDYFAVCPECSHVNVVRGKKQLCSKCRYRFSPSHGNIGPDSLATCHKCAWRFLPGTAAKLAGGPQEKIVALAIGDTVGARWFVTPTSEDIAMALRPPVPRPRPLNYRILQGQTTEQILAWGYQFWADLFTPRHLALLKQLSKEVRKEPDPNIRSWLILSLSASLDFMSTLCSFRGPRFGAVRTATAHHILRPALTSLENNPLGPQEISGTIERIFYNRILPAVPSSSSLVTRPASLRRGKGRCYLYWGTSAKAHLPHALIDAVVTDPPYFSKIFYQDLAQIYAAFLGTCGVIENAARVMTEAAEQAVENQDSTVFQHRLTSVWQRCVASLRPGGVIAFSFRSSEPEAWIALALSLINAGLMCYRADVAVAEAPKTLTKSWARYPTTLDVILFCRVCTSRPTTSFPSARSRVCRRSESKERQLVRLGHLMSKGDRIMVRFGQWMVDLTSRHLHTSASWNRLEHELRDCANVTDDLK